MRITTGKLRHRIIKMTNLETTRETQDKVRMAIFNMLGQYFDGGKCLDLFAGSGAMGIEAYSRGMEYVYLNDLNKDALKVCKENCQSLDILDNFKLTNQDYVDFSNSCNELFDLIILDPPYKMDNISEILEVVYKLSKPGTNIIFEMSTNSIYPESLHDLKLLKVKKYGIKNVCLYRRS